MAAHARSALAALHGSPDARERQAANEWLVEFTGSSNAFAAARELVLSAEHHVAFYGASVLHTKVAAEWHSMGESERAAVYEELWGLLATPTLTHLVLNRLALALAAAAGRSPGGEARLLTQAVEMLRDPASRMTALRLISAAADEFDPGTSKRLSSDQDAGVEALARAWPEVWAALAEALHGMGWGGASGQAQASLDSQSNDPVCLCLEATRSLLRWVPLPQSAGAGATAMGDGTVELANLSRSLSEWINVCDGSSTISMRRAGCAFECLSELFGRKTAGVALRVALPPMLPALGSALLRLPAIVGAAAMTPPTSAEAMEYGSRLCFCMCELSRNWLVPLVPEAAPSLVNALSTMLAGESCSRLDDELFWRCVEVCEAVVDAQITGEEGGGSALGGAQTGAATLLEQQTVDAMICCVPPVLLRLSNAAEAHGGEAVCLGDWIGGSEAAAEAAELIAAAAADGVGVDDGANEIEDELKNAGELSCGLLLALTAERPSTFVTGLSEAMRPALTEVTSLGEGGAARAGTLAALLGAVVPTANEAHGPLLQLLRLLMQSLPSVFVAAQSGRRARRAHLSLLRLLLIVCSTLCGHSPAEGEASDALGFLLAELLSTLGEEAKSCTDASAAQAATALLVRSLSRRWPPAARASAGYSRALTDVLPLASRFPPNRRPPLVAAAVCAQLLPTVGATEPAACHDLLSSLCVAWAELPTSATDADATVALSEAEPAARCIAIVAHLLAGETRTVKMAFCAPILPRLPALIALLERAATLSPPPHAEIASLLRLLIALVRSAGAQLGAQFVMRALSATLHAVGSVAASVSRAGPESNGLSLKAESNSWEDVLCASIGVLREAAEPPVHRATERSQVLRDVLIALSPHALGGMLSNSVGVPLSDARHEELVDVVAAVVRGHWNVLETMPADGTALLSVLHAGLTSAVAEPQCFARCLASFSRLVQRLMLHGFRPPQWLLSAVSQIMPIILVARLDGAHEGAHDEVASCLFTCCNAIAEAQNTPTGECAGSLITSVLETHGCILAADVRQRLASDFVRNDPNDLPSFGRALGRLANDVRHLLSLSRQYGSPRRTS